MKNFNLKRRLLVWKVLLCPTQLILDIFFYRFKLNHNSNRLLPGEKNHSIWVGDLTPEVDDLSLYRFFSARFQSIVSAKGKRLASVTVVPCKLFILIFQYLNMFQEINDSPILS